MEGQGFKFYENSGYIDTRIQRKTLIIDIDIGTGTDISVTLEEPISINKESEIYLDSFTTFHAFQNKKTTAPQFMGFLLDIKEFNIQTISTNQNQNGKIIIPNEDTTGGGEVVIHKGKKLNYICSINPTTISSISGSITKLAGTGAMFGDGTGRFIAEFSIVSKKD
jgi:hypothetical protein